ncbi:heparanase-like [Montipora foliosa]|uniref:heparanase-like n=1 Tax=Montipora foliosa TaxID=591990 RepID=UPI0035F2051F
MDGITPTEEGSSPKIPCTVEIKMHKAIAVVDERFLSVCMSWRNRERWKFDSKRETRLIALTKALSPAYMRIGGNPSNFLVFRSTSGEERTQPYGELTEQIEEEDLDRINEIAENAVWRVLFALSSLRRQMNGSWDPSNTYEIIKYVEDRGYKFGWELGNEYNLLENFDASISPEQLVEDYRTLKQYLSSPATLDNFLVGPDVTQPRGIAMEYLERFLEKGHSTINAVTWHQ